MKCDVLIVGGGLIGLSTAISLFMHHPDLTVVVFDNGAKHCKFYALSKSTIEYLTSLDININDTGDFYEMLIYGDDDNHFHLSANDANVDYLACLVNENTLYKQLKKRISEIKECFYVQDTVLSIVHYTDYVAVTTASGSLYEASLLIGSDGSKSYVREYAGFSYHKYAYKQYVFFATLKLKQPHLNVAKQWFSNDGSILALLPMFDDNLTYVVLSNIDYKTTTECLDFIASTASLKGIELVGETGFSSLDMYIVPKIYYKRSVLIGDAAHVVHPLAGIGVNLGFIDSKVLTNHLKDFDVIEFGHRTVLAGYAKKRMWNIYSNQFGCHLIYKLFSISQLYMIRNYGIKILNSIDFIKRKLILKMQKL